MQPAATRTRLSACARAFGFVLALVAAAPANAAAPVDAAERKAVIGQPATVEAFPQTVTLNGVRDARQLVVSGKYADGTLRDLTSVVEVKAEPAGVVEVQEGAYLRPKKNGTATVTINANGKEVRVAVKVEGMDTPTPVSFRRDVIAAMNVGGCNAGACHGTPSGKNGFKLSLRGFDPAADFLQLTREQFGRRTDKHDPEASLMFLKSVGRVPHEGGQRFGATSVPGEMTLAWLAEGLKDDAATLPPLKKIEVTPPARLLKAPSKWQQLAVLATFGDTTRDTTRLTVFSSSDPSIADVSPTGLVEFKRSGEVAILCRYLEELVAVRITYLEPRDGFVWPTPPETNFVDKHTFAKLKQMSIAPSDLSEDYEFVRRAYLDCIGRMPTTDEAKAFLADKDAKKRDKLIDALVDTTEFADFWSLKWADVLRSSRKTIQVKGSYGMQAWLRNKFLKNEPMDKIVQEIITASGNSYTNPPANYYRIAKDPTALAETTAQLFLGVRMQCAKCHNHPFERWSQDDYYGMAAWFARVKTKPEPVIGTKPAGPAAATAEVIYTTRDGEVNQLRTGKQMKPRYIGTGDADVKPGEDRRAVLAVWLTSAENAFFSKSVANRVWFHLMGKGIVDPVDDFRDSNPSCNDELLDALAKDFAKNKFDMKLLVKTIMKSRTYQLSAQPNDSNRDDGKYFSHAVTKLLTAEQLLDAICDFTAMPEKFAGLPAGTRAIQLPDGEVNHPFLKAFGQPARELACECERESDGNLAQALQLINGPTVNEKVRGANNRLGKLLAAKKADDEILTELYYAALGRAPFADEKAIALEHVNKREDKRKAWEDLVWALINTREFLFRH